MCQAIQEIIEDREIEAHMNGWNEGHENGWNEGHTNGWNEGSQETSRKFAVNLSQIGFTPEMIAKVAGTSEEMVMNWLSGK